MSDELPIIPEGQHNPATLHFGAAGGGVYTKRAFRIHPLREQKMTAPGAAASQNELQFRILEQQWIYEVKVHMHFDLVERWRAKNSPAKRARSTNMQPRRVKKDPNDSAFAVP